MISVSPARYFMAVTPSPPWIHAAFGTAVALGAWTLWLNPQELDSALAPPLFLQMFAVSSGFGGSAARGHFDPLLVSGRSRPAIAVGSLIAAAAPGAVSWAAIVLFALLSGCALSMALAPQRHLAFILISGAAWSAGLLMPRLAAGAVWSALLIALAVSRMTLGTPLALVQVPPDGVLQVFSTAGLVLVCPFLLLGSFAGASDVRVLGTVAAVVLLIVWWGVSCISRRDYSLAEAS